MTTPRDAIQTSVGFERGAVRGLIFGAVLKHEPLRVVSYNVRYFGHALRGAGSTLRSKRGIAQGFASLDPSPHIICLQEVETISIRSRWAHSVRHDEETQLEAFMAELQDAFASRKKRFPYEAIYFRAHAYRVRNVSLYTTGLAILVDVDRLHVDSHNAGAPEEITHHHVLRFKARKQTRICAYVRLMDEEGRPFHVFNTHLSLPTPFHKGFWSGGGRMGFGVNQVQEARSLASFVKKNAGREPLVVCGDFNSPPGSPVFHFLTEQAGLACAQSTLGQIDPSEPRKFPTAGLMRLRMHLDHVFYGPGITWVDLEGTRPFDERESPFFRLSDHVPLIGRFQIAT